MPVELQQNMTIGKHMINLAAPLKSGERPPERD